jgi:hypothetical protein
MTLPDNSCRQITVFATQSSSKTSAKVALSLGSICNMRPIICLLSLGKSRNSRQGPLITSGFFSAPSSEALPAPSCDSEWCLVSCPDSASASLATACCTSPVDLEGAGSEILRISVPGVGGEAKSLYELSVMRGIFHGNRRNDMQQKMIASDQISAG